MISRLSGLPARPLVAALVAIAAGSTPLTAAGPPGGALMTYRVRARALGSEGGVTVGGDGFGSAIAPVPGKPDELYGLSDRGPNVDGPVPDSKIFALPDYHPAIARFRLRDGAAELVATIPLRDAAGAPLTGLVPPRGAGSTGETAYDLAGRTLASRSDGVDPEGLVALRDGTFWVSEEYGPSLMHFAADGRMLERVTPFAPNGAGHRLPAELARRVPNRGIEALAVTPDGKTLVALMQSALANEISTGEAKSTAALRIVTYAVATGETHEYLYLLEDPSKLATMTSDITAVTSTEFLVVEQDIRFPGAGSKLKGVFEISLDGATDLSVFRGDAASLDPERGLLLSGKTIEAHVKSQTTDAATATLAALGVRAVRKRLFLDLDALLLAADPAGRLFAHDKVEGIGLLDKGKRLVLSNDCDFGVGATDPPSQRVAAKTVPATRERDFGEFLVVDLERSKAAVGAAPPAAATKHDRR